MTRLDAEMALSGKVQVQQGGYSISRALAAAGKRLLLLPDERWGPLELGACGGWEPLRAAGWGLQPAHPYTQAGAAERRAPSCCRAARVEYALLLYLDRRYDDAWLELGILAERRRAAGGAASAEDEQLAVLQEKIRLMLAVA
jgi:hypothetical protein